MICLANETFDPEKDMIIFDPMATWKKTKIAGGSYTLRELLVPVFQKGECVYTSPTVMEIKDICKKELDTLWDETRRFVNPQEVYVDLSDKLFKIKSELLEQMLLLNKKRAVQANISSHTGDIWLTQPFSSIFIAPSVFPEIQKPPKPVFPLSP